MRSRQRRVAAYYAVYVRTSNLHPAKFVRTLLPVFLLPFYMAVYAAWAEYLFEHDTKKKWCFRSWCGFYMRFR